MKELLGALLEELNAGNPAMVVDIVESEGSAPRGAGASMLVPRSGKSLGTVGGGAAEAAAIRDAVSLLEQGRSDMRTYDLHPNAAGGLGMVCGGKIRLVFRRFCPNEDTIHLIGRMLEASRARTGAYAVVPLSGTHAFSTFLHAAGQSGDANDLLRKIAPDGFDQKNIAVRQSEGEEYYVEPLDAAPCVYLFGCGHVAQALAGLIGYIGLDVVAYDDRPAFASEELFPAASRVIAAPFDEFERHVHTTRDDMIVVMTHGHMADFEVLCHALKQPARYIGCIGSRKKVAFVQGKLRLAGFSDQEIARIHSPIGLNIGAETPREIAVSIAAEIIAFRANQDPREGWSIKA